MNKMFISHNSLILMVKSFLVKLPSPLNISLWWNFGFMLGVILMVQIISGLFLSMHYMIGVKLSFFSVIHIIQDVNYGWLMRLIHMNGASLFFICVYIHIGRGLYYGSYKLKETWFLGVVIFLLMMMTAFLGYVLPWGQMSFWGATVITNLISAFPYVGQFLVEWLWGGFSVDNATLNRFYTFHFILPFILLVLVILHLMFLHETGSNNPLGLNSDFMKISFHKYFTLKDLMSMFWMLFLFIIIVLEMPYSLGDPENFIMANSMITPLHIQPEWYFLFAYTILRSITNKLGGVIALLMSILILMILPFINKVNFQGLSFYPFSQFYYWTFFFSVLILTWLGMQVVEYPYIILSQVFTIYYFMFYIMNYLLMEFWDYIMKF